ncbi:precorrin-2 C(20)-methyltransferase [Frateuria aurantia]
MMGTTGRLLGLGVGPGDPELITLKTLRHLRAAPVVAYFAGPGRKGHALSTIESHLDASQQLLRLEYPLTTEAVSGPRSYDDIMVDFYDAAASRVAEHLATGHDVAVICEGDPMLYGSYMYLHDRLAARYPGEVVPGVCAMLAGAAMLGRPLVYRDQSLSVVAGTLPAPELAARLESAEAAVIMKLGRNLGKVRDVLLQLRRADQALYIEQATLPGQRMMPLMDVDPSSAPYFSMVLVPGRRWLT